MTDESEMTLVFELDALRRLAAPGDAFRDARSWTEHVGVVSDEEPERVRAFADRIDVSPDFTGSVTGEPDGLTVVRRQFPAARHVFVGTTDPDATAARSHGWEFLHVAEAADAAGWSLAESAGRWRAGSEDGGTHR